MSGRRVITEQELRAILNNLRQFLPDGNRIQDPVRVLDATTSHITNLRSEVGDLSVRISELLRTGDSRERLSELLRTLDPNDPLVPVIRALLRRN
ncbi:transcription factor ILI3-like [Salvia hispanica]|uniref:transcription factor ILI3-like n=1 Tax=Salvia hispanica TaxID=49212 RepID=UPI0020090F9D|nr:transcription factor ILI3-like [Salvia hispanica]